MQINCKMALTPKVHQTVDELVAGIKIIYESEDVNVDLYMSLQNKVYTMFKENITWEVDDVNASSKFAAFCREIFLAVITFLHNYVRDIYDINYVIKTDEEYLVQYTKEANKYKQSSKVLGAICTPVHFYWINNVEKLVKKKPLDFYKSAMEIWELRILKSSLPILNRSVFNLLAMDRSGNKIDKSFLRNAILNFTEQSMGEKNPLNLPCTNRYEKQFINDLLDKTMDFYTKDSDENYEKLGLLEYTKYVANRIKEEITRMLELKLPTTWNIIESINEVCENALIESKIALISKTFIELLQSDAVNIWKQHIISEGYSAIINCNFEKKPVPNYADAIAEVVKKYKNLVTKHFPTNRRLLLAITIASKKFFSPNIFKITECENPELISFNEYRKCLVEIHKLNDPLKTENQVETKY
ncbi:cullin homolog 1-like isoform X2 [Teleopsis dalmanni]|uniref:cullin homolog 1-like isoform X2 n=1 Tax=Teleopsis dalmanni TaxID=139649 RepID=UPI0018CDBC6B|nr:cullin homolog 1-like isoform X2 [Teleopsis dalmanni]